MEYNIDPISAASPDMDDAEFVALKQSIADIGQLVSIVVAEGRIIDGRKRYRACAELGKAPAIIELPIGADPVTHATALNILRTQYSTSQRAMYASAIAIRKNGGDRREQSLNLDSAIPTTRQAAKAMGVSTAQIHRAKRVRQLGIPEVVAAVERGEITVHSAQNIAESVPKEGQVAALKAATTMPRNRNGDRTSHPGLADGHRPRLRRRGEAELADKAIGVLVYTAQELETAIEGVGEIPDPERRLAQLDDVARTVRRAREILKGRATG